MCTFRNVCVHDKIFNLILYTYLTNSGGIDDYYLKTHIKTKTTCQDCLNEYGPLAVVRVCFIVRECHVVFLCSSSSLLN